MDNGRNLIEMCVFAFETPDDEVESGSDEGGAYDFSARQAAQAFQHPANGIVAACCTPREVLRRGSCCSRLHARSLGRLELRFLPLSAGAFRVFVLRAGRTIICAATVRIFGDIFAEIPFVGTREDYRRGPARQPGSVDARCVATYCRMPRTRIQSLAARLTRDLLATRHRSECARLRRLARGSTLAAAYPVFGSCMESAPR